MSAGKLRIERLVTSGTFSLDGETHDVDNNVWIIGDDESVVVIDPAHDPKAVAEAVGEREVSALLLTHGHDDHIRYVFDAQEKLGDPPILLNAADSVLWDQVFDDNSPTGRIDDGDTFAIAGLQLTAIHTPGHSPGSICFYIASGLTAGSLPQDVREPLEEDIAKLSRQAESDSRSDGPLAGSFPDSVSELDVPVVISGDTLFNGGPGATGRSYSSFETIIESIRERLFALPINTVVLTGHGDPTMIGLEKPHLQDWIDRGH